MTKTQIQLPDALYREAKRVAKEREISLAEVMRRGLEYITRVYPPMKPTGTKSKPWKLPDPLRLGLKKDPFADPDWRAELEVETAIDRA
jgi:hypothetical protein